MSHLVAGNNQNQIFKFADDVSLINSTPKDMGPLNEVNREISHVASWASENKMPLNLSKSCCIKMGYNKGKSIPGTNNDTNVPFVNKLKLLGLNIDHGLTWKLHIDKVIKSQSARLHLLRVLI